MALNSNKKIAYTRKRYFKLKNSLKIESSKREDLNNSSIKKI